MLTYVGNREEVPVEQQYDATGAPLAQAARTVLPGEPFDPPAASMVPGPRPASEAHPPEAPTAPVPGWNYDPGPQPYSPPGYTPAPAPDVSEQSVGESDFDALHEYATLPFANEAPPGTQAPQGTQGTQYAPKAPQAPHAPKAFASATYPGPPTAPAWPAATAVTAVPAQPFGGPYPAGPDQPQAAPPYPPGDAPLPPLPPAPSDGSRGNGAGKRRARRKAPDRRLLAVALVAVLAGGGYVGYTQLTKKSDASATPVAPVVTATPRYGFPTNLAGFTLETGAAASAQQRELSAAALAAYPTFGKTASVASFGPGNPALIAVAFHPGRARLSSAYSAVLAGARTPAKGNAVGTFAAAIPGAAGGQMTCGGQRGKAPVSYCVWRGKSTVGMLSVGRLTQPGIIQILTRELRAYAEH